MRPQVSLIVGLAVLLCPLLLPAQTADEPGTVVVGAQAVSTDGDEAKFREDSLGEQSGFFLEELEFHKFNRDFNLDISARYTTGRWGWVDLEVTGDRWSGGFESTLITNWSNTAFADDILPSGTPVSDLYPGTTHLIPLLGVSSPRTQSFNGQAWATYRWSGNNRVTLRAGAWRRDGERVPNYGGFSFSDVGTSSFYTAGLEFFDSSASWFDVEGVFQAGPVGLRLNAGRSNTTIERTNQLPAFSRDRFLDFNEWRDASETDTTWLNLDAAWYGRRAGLYGAVAWADVSNSPAGGDRRVDESGSLVQDGLSLHGGANDVDVFAGALGGSWRPVDLVALTLSFDTRSSEGNGSVDLFMRSSPIAPTASTFEEDRVGGTFQVKLGAGGPWWVRLRARGTSTDLDRSETRERYSQDVVRTTDRLDARLDASVDIAKGWELSGWARMTQDEVEVDLVDLWWGYATDDWSSESTGGALALGYRAGGVHASLSATVNSTEIDSGVPYFDPVFDPSVDLMPTNGDSSVRRLWGSLLWPFSNGSFWVEAGWLESQFEFANVVELPGFELVDETVSGTVAAFGADFGAWNNGRVSGRLEWTQGSGSLDNDLLRGHVQFDHTFGSGFALFGRWAYWEYTNNLAPTNDYAVNVIAVGVRASF
ncbi:MAG: hypothetical protein GY906_05630 [bacterium]|nr:hypothetical protein [bacterium]